MAKQKYYVVWNGRQKGIFTSWEACKNQISGYKGAMYKSFPTIEEAQKAFQESYTDYITPKTKKNAPTPSSGSDMPILDSISVDAAWNTTTGKVEYQGVYTKTKELLFKQGPFESGTNNIVEFLAIVHALAYCQKNHLHLPIYSDSQTAIKWVKNKKANTRHQLNASNEKLFELLRRAESWLAHNDYDNPILKWQTDKWGEIPADFGRK